MASVDPAPAPAKPAPRSPAGSAESTPVKAPLLDKAGKIDRLIEDTEVNTAMREPPQTTRAKLRGDFIRHAKAKRRDYTVDWVHLKLNDQAQRTVLCKDPFRSADERVEQLIAHM